MKNGINEKKAILRFAALRRVSTEQQEKEGESLRTQTSNISRIVAELGGTITEWYGGQESATPGHEKQEVARLLSDLTKKRFNAVIVNDPDRWSRDNASSREGLEAFREHGIRFFTGSTERNLFNPNDILFLSISAVIGEYFARNQMEKSLKNRIERAKRGMPTSGKLPFGRLFIRSKDRQDGQWEIDKEKQRMVKDAAKRYLAGEAIEDLAKEYGVNGSNLWKVLSRVSGRKWQLEFKSKVLNIAEVVEIKIPPLLPDATIQAIHAKAEANRTYTHGHIKHHYLFARMIQCEHCGYAMFGQTNHNGFRYYRHAHKERDRKCPGPQTKAWVSAAEIEDNAMRHLFETFGNPSAVQRAVEKATPNNEKTQEAAKRLEQVTSDLLKLEASRQRILNLIVKDQISESSSDEQLGKLKEREQKLNAERTRLSDELAHVPTRLGIVTRSKEVAAQFRQYTNAKAIAKGRHANTAFDEMSYDEKRRLCQSVFSGKTADGKRMGISISWNESGKKWRYTIEGHLIEARGPANKDGFVFGAAPEQKELVSKTARH